MAKPEDIVTEARKRFERAKSYYSPLRILAEEDTRFAMGDSDNGWQWPQDISTDRNIGKRVCLTINTTAQHCNQVINDIRRNRPSCKVSPVDDGADKKTANLLAGLIRNIQASSNADDAHDVAAEHAIYGGEGYWRIITEYETETSFDQAISIKPIVNPNRVYIDPDAKELDKSDAEWGFVFENQSKESFKREYPDIDPSSWIDDKQGWIDDETFVRAEYFYCEYEKDTLVLQADGSTVLKSEVPDAVGKERKTTRKVWHQCIIVGGHPEPLDETIWVGKYLPIIAAVGKEVNVNGLIVRKGLVRDLKDPARIVNYAYSETVQTLALQNKIPYIAAAEAIDGFENDWKSANMQNAAYLPFNAYDDSGNQLPVPKRQDPAVMPAAQIQLLDLSLAQMRGVSGQQNANFGIKSEAQSGIGIQRLKTQGETATFHFPDNLARALKYEAKQLIDLIPKIYTREKIIRIMGLDGKDSHATIDPNLPAAHHEIETDNGLEEIFNPTVGRYDVAIDTGPSFQTQRQESAAAMVEYAKAYPPLMQIAGDIVMRSNDFQNAEELADRFEKTLPPGLLGTGKGDKAQLAQATQQLQQMQQQMQEMQQQGMMLEQENAQLKSGEQTKAMQLQAKQEEVQINVAAKQQEYQLLAAERQKQIDAELQAAREKAQIDAEVAIEKARIDAQTKKEIAVISGAADKEIAAMTAIGESTPEEEAEFKAMEKPSRKVITIQAPSGGVYTGTIEESNDD